jgi:hypothetical protein
MFKGTSNKSQCDAEVSILLPNKICSYDNNECSFDNVYQPSVKNSDFLAFSNYYYALGNTAKLLDINIDDLDLEKFKNATNLICSSSLAELNELNSKNNASISDKFLTNQCFSNVFILTLVSRYGFTNFDNFKSTDNVNGYSLNWALGYLINELNRDDFLPYERPERIRIIQLPLFIILTCIFSVLSLIAIIFLLIIRIKSRNSFTPTTNAS